jgi:hypothetical protein
MKISKVRRSTDARWKLVFLHHSPSTWQNPAKLDTKLADRCIRKATMDVNRSIRSSINYHHHKRVIDCAGMDWIDQSKPGVKHWIMDMPKAARQSFEDEFWFTIPDCWTRDGWSCFHHLQLLTHSALVEMVVSNTYTFPAILKCVTFHEENWLFLGKSCINRVSVQNLSCQIQISFVLINLRDNCIIAFSDFHRCGDLSCGRNHGWTEGNQDFFAGIFRVDRNPLTSFCFQSSAYELIDILPVPGRGEMFSRIPGLELR